MTASSSATLRVIVWALSLKGSLNALGGGEFWLGLVASRVRSALELVHLNHSTTVHRKRTDIKKPRISAGFNGGRGKD